MSFDEVHTKMADMEIVYEKKQMSTESLMRPESQYLVKRRNTERIPEGLNPLRCRLDNHSHQAAQSTESCFCTKRRHTLVPGVSQKELFEKETKLIVLEFLKVHTPRLKFESKDIAKIHSAETRTVTTSHESTTVAKREFKKLRKVSGKKSKTVTLGEKERQEICELESKQMKKRLQRSSSDMTAQQYELMKRKFKQMQLPIIQWLEEHVVVEDQIQDDQDTTLIIPKITTTTINEEETESIEHEILLQQDTSHDVISDLPRRPRGLTLNIPRRSIALQLVESSIFTPETMAVQKLEQISEEIMRDYGDVLEKSMTDLLNPLKLTNSITYDIFSKVAKKVYNFATTSTDTLARLAMVLNVVKETMVEGNLNEEQLELLVDHSTKFLTENADESLVNEGRGWAELGLNTSNGDEIFPTISEHFLFEGDSNDKSPSPDYSAISDENQQEHDDENNVWAPYGIAAFTVGIGLAYTCMRS